MICVLYKAAENTSSDCVCAVDPTIFIVGAFVLHVDEVVGVRASCLEIFDLQLKIFDRLLMLFDFILNFV